AILHFALGHTHPMPRLGPPVWVAAYRTDQQTRSTGNGSDPASPDPSDPVRRARLHPARPVVDSRDRAGRLAGRVRGPRRRRTPLVPLVTSWRLPAANVPEP